METPDLRLSLDVETIQRTFQDVQVPVSFSLSLRSGLRTSVHVNVATEAKQYFPLNTHTLLEQLSHTDRSIPLSLPVDRPFPIVPSASASTSEMKRPSSRLVVAL